LTPRLRPYGTCAPHTGPADFSTPADEAACEPEGRPVLRPADDAAPAVQRAAACLRRLRGAPALRSTASPLGAGSSSSGGGRAERGEGGRIRRPRPEVGRARLAEQS